MRITKEGIVAGQSAIQARGFLRRVNVGTWNHTQFTGVNTGVLNSTLGTGANANNGTAGAINGIADPRVFQLGAKAYF